MPGRDSLFLSLSLFPPLSLSLFPPPLSLSLVSRLSFLVHFLSNLIHFAFFRTHTCTTPTVPHTYTHTSSVLSFCFQIDTTLFKVNASDGDGSAPNNQFFFEMTNSTPAIGLTQFLLHTNNGDFSTTSMLDRERWPHYDIVITATDNGLPTRRTSTATVRLSVGMPLTDLQVVHDNIIILHMSSKCRNTFCITPMHEICRLNEYTSSPLSFSFLGLYPCII